MIHHVSFTAENPREVATILADLIGGRVSRFGPWPGGYIAWAPDPAGTAIEVYPTGTELAPDPEGGQALFAHNYFAQRFTAVHAAISLDRTEDEIMRVAQRAGWQARRLDRGGFEVIEVWVENTVMLEVMTPAMATRYLAVVDSPRIEAAGTEFDSITLSTMVNTDVHTAWSAWTHAQKLTRWWPVPHARIDLRIHGAYELRFSADPVDSGHGTAGCRVLSYVPDRMVSFTWSTPPHLAGGRNQTWVVLTFTEVAAGTEVELVHNGFALGPAGQEHREYFRQAWRRVLHRMVDHWQSDSELTALSDVVAQPAVQGSRPD